SINLSLRHAKFYSVESLLSRTTGDSSRFTHEFELLLGLHHTQTPYDGGGVDPPDSGQTSLQSEKVPRRHPQPHLQAQLRTHPSLFQSGILDRLHEDVVGYAVHAHVEAHILVGWLE